MELPLRTTQASCLGLGLGLFYVINQSKAGVDPGIFVGGANLKKLEKMTSTAAPKIYAFSYVFMHILKKLEKNLEKIGKNLEKICPVGGECIPPIPPPGSISGRM